MPNQNMNCAEDKNLQQKISNREANKKMLRWLKRKVFKRLARKTCLAVFMEPMKNPKYYETIKNPMDIGCIINRIENGYYQKAVEPLNDFRTILVNCFKFFEYEDPIYKNGRKMMKYFIKFSENPPRAPYFRSTRKTRNATLQTEDSKVTKAVLEPETWQSKCLAYLSKIRSLSNKLDMPFASALILEQCDSLETKLSQGHFATHEQFTEESQRSFHDFCNSAINHIQTNSDSSSPKKPYHEEPIYSPLKDLILFFDSNCSSCSGSSDFSFHCSQDESSSDTSD
ncbi:bromodomain testis-specific protein-like [Drosophila obscura]|uniref:bromodomain testis-specific protein-like n=1 Tax=Drosophila obscura TaxID=7282 RepID=UPI001BB0D865|nr:bromodomain testis-specific protein-like [Drosophila obscura]